MPKSPARVVVEWAGGSLYDAGRPEGPAIRLDTTGVTGPGPVETLVCALCACTCEDILTILRKRRTPVSSLRIEGEGVRADAVPARLTSVRLTYHIEGADIEPEQAKRAVHLSVEKYCSVRDSLDPALPIEVSVIVNGAPQSEA
jgi:putative redox protein